MGVAFVFLFYLVGLGAITLPTTAIGILAGRLLSRGRYSRLRRRFQIAGGLLPLAGAGYIVLCIVTMAAFGLLTHRDFGFGDGFEVPLNNRYQFSAIDIPDIATLYDRGNAVLADSSSAQIEASKGPVLENVFAMRESGDWLYGARGTTNPRFSDDKRVLDRWFLLNTRTKRLQEVNSEANFQTLLSAQHLDPSLSPSEDFYGSHRYRWYDGLVAFCLLIPPAIALWFLIKIVKRMRSNAASAPDIENSDIDPKYPGSLRRGRFLR